MRAAASSIRAAVKASIPTVQISTPSRIVSSVQRSLLPNRSFTSTPVYRSNSPLTNILASDSPDVLPPLSIDKFTNRGYHLTDDLVVPGGLILVEGKPFLWDVDPPKIGSPGPMTVWWEGWGRERLKIFEVVLPRPEILLFGTGEQSIPVPKDIKDYISGLGISLDVMDSRNAASTFNMLQEEGRRVAVALCPLKPIDPRTGQGR